MPIVWSFELSRYFWKRLLHRLNAELEFGAEQAEITVKSATRFLAGQHDDQISLWLLADRFPGTQSKYEIRNEVIAYDSDF